MCFFNQTADNKPKEECGVFGIYDKSGKNCARTIYYALYALQHRGQESCGMAVNDDNHIFCHKDLGLVPDVFSDFVISQIKGNIGIGHVRYSTTGDNTRENAQPLASKYVKGTLTIAHNGNLTNAARLRQELQEQGAIFQSTNDTEVVAYLIAKERLTSKSIEEAVAKAALKLEGSFSLVVMSPRKLIGLRDPLGIRPLCMGKVGDDVTIFSSESCAMNAVGAEFVRDIKPGEMVVVRPDNTESIQYAKSEKTALCVFEHIYFARPDSVIDGQSVYEARKLSGKLLARQYPVDADIVIAVPDSGLCAAVGYAEESGIQYDLGLMKNRYIGRTFIQPSQDMRERSVNIKLGAMGACVKGKRVVMVDDSIVRGTTIKNIVTMLKEAGATEVHVRIASPLFLWPCYYGTDIPDRDQLVACHYSVEEICENIGADSLGYLKLESLREMVPDLKMDFCDACFTGNYPGGVPEVSDKNAFEQSIMEL